MIKKRNLFEIFNAVNKTNIDPPVDGIKKVPIDEMSLNRLFTKHSLNGFIIISANRHENTHEENNSRFKQLKAELVNAGFSYAPVYGGFVETDDNDEFTEPVIEPALVVFNYIAGTSRLIDNTGDKLKEIGLKLIDTNKYNQDSFLYAPPNSAERYYINKNGGIEMTFTGKSINDLTNHYFTSIGKPSNPYKKEKRFSFTEQKYLNESPSNVGAAMTRYGEMFFRTK